MAKQKYYVVWVGKAPGIYTSWPECQRQVDKFFGSKYKSYPSMAEAEQAYKDGWSNHWGNKLPAGDQKTSPPASPSNEEIDYDSISVDVGTRGNPGPIEYRGVNTQTGETLFSYGPISKGTNNLGEFLAIVHSLEYLQKEGSKKTVYSDSRTALKWLRDKQVATTLPRDHSTEEVWFLVDHALQWLKTNSYPNKVLKWNTESWGEIKADYGRK